jgi:hypothetical protein
VGVTLLVAVLGGAIAGGVADGTRDERAHAAGSAIIATVGISIAVRLYIAGRSSVYNLELLLPVALGGLPGLGVHFALARLVPRSGVRAVAAVGLAAATAATALVLAPGASADPPDAEVSAPRSRRALPISPGERAELAQLFGAKAGAFFKAVDTFDSLVAIYGLSGVAKAGASGQKLLGDLDRGLDGMRAEADRRIAAGEARATFDMFDAVERRVRAFLRQVRAP